MPEQFRFWGSRDPRGRAKTPILASVPQVGDDSDVAEIRLYEPIDSWGDFWGTSAREFLEALDQVTAPTIRLRVNSPGGEVYEAIAITNALRSHPARVVAVVDGLAASAASFIAASADELVMGRNTELMIHDAWGIGIGPAETMRELAGRLDAISDNIASIYAAKAGGDVADWRAAMLAETWYSAEGAVSAGLADRVDQDAADDSDDALVAAFDLSIFRGRAAGAPPTGQQGGDGGGEHADAAAAWKARHRHAAAAARHGLRLPRTRTA